MGLPYEDASSGKRALNEIRKVLQAFGCNKFGSMFDFAEHELLIQFEYKGRRVSIKASARGYAAAEAQRASLADSVGADDVARFDAALRAALRSYDERLLALGAALERDRDAARAALAKVLDDAVVTAGEAGTFVEFGSPAERLLIAAGGTRMLPTVTLYMKSAPVPAPASVAWSFPMRHASPLPVYLNVAHFIVRAGELFERDGDPA